MKTTSKALLAAMTLLSLGLAGLAQAQAPIAPNLTAPEAPLVAVDYDEDDDEGEGWFSHRRGHGDHEDHERGDHDDDDDDDGEGGCRGATDADGRCQTGQSASPPANGLFNGAAPKAQVN
ncbi:hypothetical protein [Stagnihabitans tardus]|uniref:Secreted protein n=1 Tax=Stagnihabitans tardus TaxID=2699202 RepID=A0AAE4Y873_9RHOB|nr:hypothetical protein [Stagnihabitans tardus]NBZ86994.1 hypothetical protein [Stagnihabitans tardus]